MGIKVMSTPAVGLLNSYFLTIMNEIIEMLELFPIKRELTIALFGNLMGTGNKAM